MPQPLVSIMIPAFNAEAYIQEAIESVLAQTYTQWELIIVNDGSTDNTANIIVQFDDPRIKLFEQANQGESAARNHALSQMTGDLISFLDADDIYLPNHLASAVQFLDTSPAFAGLYTDGYHCNQSGALLKTLSSRRRGPFEGDVFAETVRGSDLFGPPLAVVLRRSLIVEHGLQFDKEITIGPDWVFLTEYAAVGQFGYLDECTCLYRIHDNNISRRLNVEKRAGELAKCRIRMIDMARFNECPADVRESVFYDLLVLWLRYSPSEQTTYTRCAQFQRLPSVARGRILRQMAVMALLTDTADHQLIFKWLEESKAADPDNLRTGLLVRLYGMSPKLCRWFLETKRWREVDPLLIPPFADLELSSDSVA